MNNTIRWMMILIGLSAVWPVDCARAQDSAATFAPLPSVEEPIETLLLSDVIASVYRSFPVIQQARQEQARASGEVVSAWGQYDTKLYGSTLSEPTGFYRNNRQSIGVARQTWWGGYLSAGYRLGRGDFQPWYKERETDKGGEFKLGLGMPLLQGRAIDLSRLSLFLAEQNLAMAQPLVQQSILDSARDATAAYWAWVDAGLVLQAQRELLQLAEDRGKQFEEGVNVDKFAEIDLVLNRQLIAERQSKVFEAEGKFQTAAQKLSLFLRNDEGSPLAPAMDWLVNAYPVIEPLATPDVEAEVMAAISRRPEPGLLMIELRKLELERSVACNQLMPSLDVVAEASQDTGTPASSLGDKSQFELLVGLQGEVPIQRRKARGKIQSTDAKISQVQQKLRLQQDKISTELRAAYLRLEYARRVFEQNILSLEAALESLERYRFGFEIGKVDLIYLNLLETKANEVEIKLLDSQRAWFVALSELQLVLGLDPLDQAVTISSLPISDIIGPGHLPQPKKLDPTEFQKEWEQHLNTGRQLLDQVPADGEKAGDR